ncbi:uncharacterized protein VTP21DRAFT_10952 [Calcarisporiella thermophila]|uniref:uncharacterized protein n=1 Tax=Calcarisporiella thermophila TaxID=911321 RepID=UPI0037436119
MESRDLTLTEASEANRVENDLSDSLRDTLNLAENEAKHTEHKDEARKEMMEAGPKFSLLRQQEKSTASDPLSNQNAAMLQLSTDTIRNEETAQEKDTRRAKRFSYDPALESIILQFDPLATSDGNGQNGVEVKSVMENVKMPNSGTDSSTNESLSNTLIPVEEFEPVEQESELPQPSKSPTPDPITSASIRYNSDSPVPKSFDFNAFLEQLRHRSATPLTRYFKRFLREFERKPWTVNEQIQIIREFLDFMSGKITECELWRNADEQEIENANEGMEKLVMNRLYHRTFCPQTTDDKERDEVLSQKIAIFRWINETHLDIPITPHNESFLNFAVAELLKINHFKAPRDKLICILNCCKVIFGLIKHVEGDAGADKFLPILIYVVLKANPPQLISNVQFISRFRNPEQLQSEAGYYLTNLMGAISFIENMDASSLSISPEEFDRNIEETVKELEKERPQPENNGGKLNYEDAIHPHARRSTLDRGPLINPAKAAAFLERGLNNAQKTIQKPFNLVGKIFSDIGSEGETNSEGSGGSGTITPHRRGSDRSSHRQAISAPATPAPHPAGTFSAISNAQQAISSATADHHYPAELYYSRHAEDNAMSEAYRPYPSHVYGPPTSHSRQEHPAQMGWRQPDFQQGYNTYNPGGALYHRPHPTPPHRPPTQPPHTTTHIRTPMLPVVQQEQALRTLEAMFPNVDAEVCEAVLHSNHGNLARTIDQLLEISDPDAIGAAGGFSPAQSPPLATAQPRPPSDREYHASVYGYDT